MVPCLTLDRRSRCKPIQRENPVAEILKDAVMFHVEDPIVIFQFFQIMVRIILVEPLVKFSDCDLYDFLMSVSVRVLRDSLLMAKRLAWPIRYFHTYIFDKYVPRLVYQSWLTEHYYRVQGPSESLSDFIEAKRFFAAVLLVPDDEAGVVDNIVQGLNLQTRSRLVFAKRPSTFRELFDLAASVSHYALIDTLAPPVLTPSQSSASPSSDRLPENRARRPVTCFFCKRPGHIARDCSQRPSRVASGLSSALPGTLQAPVPNVPSSSGQSLL